MPSRKRNKGKERRAKRAEKAANQFSSYWNHWAIAPPGGGAHCNHGCELPPPDHVVTRFMNKFDEVLSSGRNIIEILGSTFELHPEVWKDADHRQTAIDIFLSLEQI